MYFNEHKSSTNIDNEFKNNQNILSKLPELFKKYKLIIFVSIAILIISLMIILFLNRKPTQYLDLTGKETITIYEQTDYVEPGYKAYDSKKQDLTEEVDIKSNLNINQVGEYQITYTLGKITKTRTIKVIAKPEEVISIYLTPVDNSINVYLNKGEKYIEPGYNAFSDQGNDFTDKVIITGTVDTNAKGIYKLTYSVTDPNGVAVTTTRLVIVIDPEINLSLDTHEYRNDSVKININVVDEYFDYIILPDNTKITQNTYQYKVYENGQYTFTVYNNKGGSKKQTIEIKNIDKTLPTGTCSIDQYNDYSIINIIANDNIGIKKYIYNNQEYITNTINIPQSLNNATIGIYDNANNYQNITCSIIPKLYISNIEQDGVIITINTKKVNNEIAGYYFSYDGVRPSKETGGYISTNQDILEVVRLPGTTYIWVEDQKGKISDVQTITLDNDVLFSTNGKEYKILSNITLETYLQNQGWSLEELNNLMIRSVRAAGLYSKDAAATSVVSILTVLAQKYQIKPPYWYGGKSWKIGADPTWGKYKHIYADDTDYYYYGLDCSGFTTWAYVNAGYAVGANGTNKYPAYFWGWKNEALSLKKENGEVGDFLANSGHVKLIIGKTETGFLTAEAKGKNYGMVIHLHKYNSQGDYKIEKGELLMNAYDKLDISLYP